MTEAVHCAAKMLLYFTGLPNSYDERESQFCRLEGIVTEKCENLEDQ